MSKRSTLSLMATVLLGALPIPVTAADFNTGPVAIIRCPAKGKLTRSYDLSTGSAPWVVTGPGLPNSGITRASPVAEASLPSGWSARLPGAAWVQPLPAMQATAHAPGDFMFTLSFQVKKAKRMPQLTLTGSLVTDEGFDLNLIEPSPVNQHIGSGIGGADERPDLASQDDVQNTSLSQSADGSGKMLGHRAGTYRLEIRTANGAAPAEMLGLLARLKLTASCRTAK
jgi:hypothetical protein